MLNKKVLNYLQMQLSDQGKKLGLDRKSVQLKEKCKRFNLESG